jgi:hypothetical protein
LCSDTTCVIVDPIGERITVVVQENRGEYTEHLVPMARWLRQHRGVLGAQAELAALPNFVERRFKREPMPFSVIKPSTTWCVYVLLTGMV